VSYPTLFTTPGVRQFAEEIDAERQRQIAKFGDQHHPDGTGSPAQRTAASLARTECQRAFAHGYGAWVDVLTEEFREALAEEDPALLRAELVQVAAVCSAWIADIDSRGAQR
jgi:protein involved in temperature-dependent protein secretion